MSNMRDAHNRLQLNPAWHCCWYFRARWLQNTAQAGSQQLPPRKLNAKLLLSVSSSSTWKHCSMDGGWWSNNNLWALSFQTIYQLSAVWSIIQYTKNLQGHKHYRMMEYAGLGFCLSLGLPSAAQRWGKSSMILHGQEVIPHSPENSNWAVAPFNESVWPSCYWMAIACAKNWRKKNK